MATVLVKRSVYMPQVTWSLCWASVVLKATVKNRLYEELNTDTGFAQIIRSKIQDFFQIFFEKQQFTSKIEWDLTTEKITLIQRLL